MDLLNAYEMLITRSPNHPITELPALVFVGDGVLRSKLEEYSKERNLDNVYFIGFKNQTELPKYYTLADVLVLPSGAGETWGLAVNEAMCFGLPIIVSDVVGCGPDLVKDNVNGFIFPLDDAEQLSLRLKDLIDDSAKRKSFGEKSSGIIKNILLKKTLRVF